MLTNKKALLFDLDGTLIDSMGIWHDIDIEYLEQFGYTVPEDLQKCIEGMHFREVAIYFKERFNIPDSIEKIEADWNEMALQKYAEEVPVKAGAVELIKWGKEQGLKLAISTSNSRPLVETFVKTRNLEQYFDYILSGDDIYKSKPDPYVYLLCAEKLKVNPSECLVFEDIIPGIMAGKNAGMEVCAVEDKYSSKIREDKIKAADYYIESYLDIVYPE